MKYCQVLGVSAALVSKSFDTPESTAGYKQE